MRLCWTNIVMVIALLACLPAVSYATPRITLKEHASVTTPTVTLSQVAELAGDDKFTTALGPIRLGHAPAMEMAELAVITRGDIQLCLELAGWQPGQYVLAGPDAVSIRRFAAAAIGAPQLELDFSQSVHEATEPSLWQLLSETERTALYQAQAGYEWNCRQLETAATADLAVRCELAPELVQVQLLTHPTLDVRELMQGRALIRGVEWVTDWDAASTRDYDAFVEMLAQPFSEIGKVERVRQLFKFRVTRRMPAIVAKRAINARQTLTPDDVMVGLVPWQRPDEICLDLAAVVGREVTFSVKAGQPLRPTLLSLSFLVRKGAPILYQYGELDTHERAVALQNGNGGDVIDIEIQRAGSKVKLRARILSAAVVGPANQPAAGK